MKRECPYCGGTGILPISTRYAATLALLKKQRQETTGAELARLAGIKNEAMCNRLRILEKHGLVVGYRDGRRILWKTI